MRFYSFIALYLFLVVSCLNVYSQGKSITNNVITIEFSENIHSVFSNSYLSIIGYYNDNPILSINKDGKNELYILNEESLFLDSFSIDDKFKDSKVISQVIFNTKSINRGYSKIDDAKKNKNAMNINLNYHDIWYIDSNTVKVLEKSNFHILDKYIDCKFSVNGMQIICSAYSDYSSCYDNDIDNKIRIYDLSTSAIKSKNIACERCRNIFIIDNRLIFNKEVEIGKGFDGYFGNIYESTIDKPEDTILIAFDVQLIAISSNGEYILGRQYLELNRNYVIINVQDRSLEYIKNENYTKERFFYSRKKNMFAYLNESSILYFKIPEKFQKSSIENNFFHFLERDH